MTKIITSTPLDQEKKAEMPDLDATTDSNNIDTTGSDNEPIPVQVAIPTTPIPHNAAVALIQAGLDVKNFDDLTIQAQLIVFNELSKDPTTGISNPAIGLMKYQRAKELKIPWANAASHMYMIKGRLGLDIHLCQALMTRPGSGIRWKYIEEYKPLYDYIDASGNIYEEGVLPPNTIITNAWNQAVGEGNIAVILKPTPTLGLDGKTTIYRYIPSDYRTIIQFTRKKKDIDDTWITETEFGRFTFRDAIRAGLVTAGSNWEKRPAYMVWKSAYWDGARKIANDILQGADDPDMLNSIPD